MAKTARHKQKQALGKPSLARQTEAIPETSKNTAIPASKTERKPVTLTTDDGITIVIPDTPVKLGRATALASEKTLEKIWGTSEEEKGCQDLRKGI
jgi:hypothetical protein